MTTKRIHRTYPSKDVAEQAIAQAKHYGWSVPTVIQTVGGWDVTFTRETDPLEEHPTRRARPVIWLAIAAGLVMCLGLACLAGIAASAQPESKPTMPAMVAPVATEFPTPTEFSSAIPLNPTLAPTAMPSATPSITPTLAPTATPSITPTLVPSPTEDPRVNHGVITPGTWLIGSEIEPGQYRGETAVHCYWARLSGLSGTLGDIISNANIFDGPFYVEIDRTDIAIQTTCTLVAPN